MEIRKELSDLMLEVLQLNKVCISPILEFFRVIPGIYIDICVCVFIYTKLAGTQLKDILGVGTFSYIFMVAFGATGRGLGRELKF